MGFRGTNYHPMGILVNTLLGNLIFDLKSRIAIIITICAIYTKFRQIWNQAKYLTLEYKYMQIIYNTVVGHIHLKPRADKGHLCAYF